MKLISKIDRLKEMTCRECVWVHLFKTKEALQQSKCFCCERITLIDELQDELSRSISNLITIADEAVKEKE